MSESGPMGAEVERQPRLSRPLWFSLLAGPFVWLAQLTIVYALASLACEWGMFPFSAAGLTGLQIVQLAVTAVAVAIMLVPLVQGVRRQRALPDDDSRHGNPDRNYSAFLYYLSMAISVASISLIIVTALPIFLVTSCR